MLKLQRQLVAAVATWRKCVHTFELLAQELSLLVELRLQLLES